jgi:hypothetical protein
MQNSLESGTQVRQQISEKGLDPMKQMVVTHLSLGTLGQELYIGRLLLNTVKVLSLIRLCCKHPFESLFSL